MFTNLIKSTTKLDRAIVISIAAMLTFNVLALTAQVQSPTVIAQVSGEAAGQA